MTSPASTNSSKEASSSSFPQWRAALAGALSGATSRTIMAPVERLKILKQLQLSHTARSSGIAHYQSTWELFHHVRQQEGMRAFWRGNTPAVLRVAGTAAINFTCLEYYKTLLRSWRKSQPSQSNKHSRRNQFWTSLVAGGMAGATSTTIMYPFEFARTRLAMDMGTDKNDTTTKETTTKQSQPSSTQSNGSLSTTTSSSKQALQRRQYKGMMDVVFQITKSDGPLGLFRGYGVALVGGIFYRVLYLGGYDALKHEYAVLRTSTQEPLQEPATSNNQHDSSSSSGAPSSSSTSPATPITWWERLLVAQTISLTAGTLSYPFDSVRRRMMMQAGLPVEQQTYRNALHCIHVMWQTEGIRGFYRGLAPNIIRSLGGALLLVGYDTFRAVLS